MDLWIRSQDKTKLIKTDGIGLTPIGLSIYSIGTTGVLATYSTKERALKILDEIQRHLAYLEQMISAGRAMELDFESDFVYEMPGE